MNPWTRRSLLVGGGLLALPALSLVAGELWCQLNSMPQKALFQRALLASFYRTSTAARLLGNKYLAQTGAIALDSLRRREATDCIKRAVETGCRAMLVSAIEQACRDDFRLGRIYCIDGWVMAQTELDVAALSIGVS